MLRFDTNVTIDHFGAVYLLFYLSVVVATITTFAQSFPLLCHGPP